MKCIKSFECQNVKWRPRNDSRHISYVPVPYLLLRRKYPRRRFGRGEENNSWQRSAHNCTFHDRFYFDYRTAIGGDLLLFLIRLVYLHYSSLVHRERLVWRRSKSSGNYIWSTSVESRSLGKMFQEKKNALHGRAIHTNNSCRKETQSHSQSAFSRVVLSHIILRFLNRRWWNEDIVDVESTTRPSSTRRRHRRSFVACLTNDSPLHPRLIQHFITIHADCTIKNNNNYFRRLHKHFDCKNCDEPYCRKRYQIKYKV